jgi:hypothetical protein
MDDTENSLYWGWFVMIDVTFVSTVSQMGPRHWYTQDGGWGGLQRGGPPKEGGWGGYSEAALPPKAKLKTKTCFVDTMLSEVLCDLHFSLNQPFKSADDW